jgi:hypothetical protein
MDYCAIIGDIVKSRSLVNRVNAQEEFINVIEVLVNEKYSNYIASKFTVTLGDEFQGLIYKEYTYLYYDIIKFVSEQMAPIRLVYGIGVGAIDIEPNHEIAIRSDGPAYHYARKMVMKAKQDQSPIHYFSNSDDDALINSLINCIVTTENRMTKKQKEVVKLYREYGSQSKVAIELNIEQSSISRILNAANYYAIDKAEKCIKDYLGKKYKNL